MTEQTERERLIAELEAKQKNGTIAKAEREMLSALYRGTSIEMADSIRDEDLADALALIPVVREKRRIASERGLRHAEACRAGAVLPRQQVAAKKAKDAADALALAKRVEERLARGGRFTGPDGKEVPQRVEAGLQTLVRMAENDKALGPKLLARKRFNRTLRLKQAEEALENTAQRKEAQRASAVTAIIEQVGRLASDADPIYAALKSFHNKANPTEKEHMVESWTRPAGACGC